MQPPAGRPAARGSGVPAGKCATCHSAGELPGSSRGAATLHSIPPACGPRRLSCRRKGCPCLFLFPSFFFFLRGGGVGNGQGHGAHSQTDKELLAPQHPWDRMLLWREEKFHSSLGPLTPGHGGDSRAVRGKGSPRSKSLAPFCMANPLWGRQTENVSPRAQGPKDTAGGSVPQGEADTPPKDRLSPPVQDSPVSSEVERAAAHTYPRPPRWTAPASLRRSPARFQP